MLYIEDFKTAFRKARAIQDMENEIEELKVKLNIAKNNENKKKIKGQIESFELRIAIQNGDLFDIEKFIAEADDSFVSQLMYHRFIKGESWLRVSTLSGGYCTADCVRRIVERYLKKKGITKKSN